MYTQMQHSTRTFENTLQTGFPLNWIIKILDFFSSMTPEILIIIIIIIRNLYSAIMPLSGYRDLFYWSTMTVHGILICKHGIVVIQN